MSYGVGAEREEQKKLPLTMTLFSNNIISIPSNANAIDERSGMVTPPLQTSASVPFRWEQEPGKPRPCSALLSVKSLELPIPPRLLIPSPSTLFNSHSHTPCMLLNNHYASWTKKLFKLNKRDVSHSHRATHVFPSSKDTSFLHTNVTRINPSATLYHTNTRFWKSICEGLKHVLPWKSKKQKKDGSGISL
ncbi:hypothetical protein Fmac_007202 [Flemingia macrophylla]|uniref:Uncharacterized protein n=1 Tax=Flemingia macrophylla TaxID=520843 RepID=A0ABD1NE11_9FABA